MIEAGSDGARKWAAQSNVTFADYAATWIETYGGRTSRGIETHTRDDYRKRLEKDAVPFFGKIKLAAIEPRHVKEYAAKIASRGVSDNTVRLGVAPVRALLATAVEEGLLPSNPALGLRLFVRPRVEQGTSEEVDAEGQSKALTEEELERLLDKLPDRFVPFFEFLAAQGLRIGEAIELRHRDLDLGERFVHVRRRYYRGTIGLPKGEKRRSIRLHEDLARDLWELRKRTRAGDDDLVFTAEKGARIEPSNLMSRVFKPAARAAGIKIDVGFHTFRHTCGTRLDRAGWSAEDIQHYLGHSDASFTHRVYVHRRAEDGRDPSALALPRRGGNKGATRPTETSRDGKRALTLVSTPVQEERLAVSRGV